MKEKMEFKAIAPDGKGKLLREWDKADVLSLVEKLASERADLYSMLEKHLEKKTDARTTVCSEPTLDGHRGKCEGKEVTSFRSTLTEKEFETLAKLANAYDIFAKPRKVKAETLAAFFRCEPTGLQVHNLRLFCVMMTALAHHGYIGGYWQAPIYRGRLLLAYEKKGYINRSDLTTANHEINNTLMDNRVESINRTIRTMKKPQNTDMSV